MPLFQGTGDCRSPSSGRVHPGGGRPACAGRSATFKKHGNVSEFRIAAFLKGMKQNGYDEEFAERCFSQIEGFGSYGFPESHAASFRAACVWSDVLKSGSKCRTIPHLRLRGFLNSQRRIGFYAPAQIVRDAREHGVEVRPVSINASYWDNVMEADGRGGLALRLGFRQIKSMREEDAAWITGPRAGNGYLAVEDVWRRARCRPPDTPRDCRGRRLRRRRPQPPGRAPPPPTPPRPPPPPPPPLPPPPPPPLGSEGHRRREAPAALRRRHRRRRASSRAGSTSAQDDRGRGGDARITSAMRLTLRAHPMSFLRARLTPEAA